jgi:hypothetical protein
MEETIHLLMVQIVYFQLLHLQVVAKVELVQVKLLLMVVQAVAQVLREQ